MDLQNLAYALVQVVHNFGAVAVVGGAASALGPNGADSATRQRRLAWLVLSGWGLQAASGATFGAVSFHYYGEFPDIHGIAMAALALKVACAVAGFLLAAVSLVYGARWTDGGRRRTWQILLALGATALTAAAFLRWFS